MRHAATDTDRETRDSCPPPDPRVISRTTAETDYPGLTWTALVIPPAQFQSHASLYLLYVYVFKQLNGEMP